MNFPDNARWYYLFQDISSSSIHELIGNMESAFQKLSTEKIVLFVSSSGGELGLATAFYHWVRFAKIPLITVGMGEVCSSGVLIYLAGKERYILPNANFYFHPGSTGISAKTSPMESKALLESFEHAKSVMLSIITAETDISHNQLKEIDTKSGILKDKELVELRFAKGILSSIDDY